jgi:glycosyltransferase involved in cell wall biosynthesis
MLVLQARHRGLHASLDLHFALSFEGRLSRELNDANAPSHHLGNVRVRNPFSIWFARRRLTSLLRQEPFDVAITHGGWAQAVFGPVIRSAAVPLVAWTHSAITGRHWLDRWALMTPPDLVICNSYYVRQSLIDRFGNQRGDVFHNPHVVYCALTAKDEESSLQPQEQLNVRKELNTPREATVIIQVSRMEQGKGHELHLKALSLLRDVPDWVCWQVGGAQRGVEAPYYRRLKRIAVELGIGDRVVFLGERTDVGSLLSAADIYCQPNTSPEGFGNTFIEGLLHRLPVVTTAIGGGKEIVNESCGIRVPPDDPPTLAASLRYLIQNPFKRVELGAAGPARARELCDVETQMSRLHELLTSLVQVGVN